jgi:RNA polymerase sigma-70 factor (ECF subfamily)
MPDDQTFLNFIDRIRAGDEQAAAELVKGYEPLIRREVRLQLDDRSLIRLFDSMDICQSVLASFFVRTAAGEYEIASSAQLVKLLVNMARNKLISAARREYMQRRDVRRRTRRGDPALDQIADQRQEPIDVIANRELLSRIYDRLSPEELRISRLRSGGAAWEDIASEMGGTSQSRRMQFSRAIDRVAQQLGVDLTT